MTTHHLHHIVAIVGYAAYTLGLAAFPALLPIGMAVVILAHVLPLIRGK